MGKIYILISRKKGSKGRFKKAGPYEYPRRSQFGSLARIRRDNPNYEYELIDKELYKHIRG